MFPTFHQSLTLINSVCSVYVWYQVEQSSGYEVISQTFTEAEKCGLKEIQAFRLPMVAIPLAKHSGYRELFATRSFPFNSHYLLSFPLYS